MFWRIALRNLLRHKRRSLLTFLAFASGAITMILSFGIADGMYGDMIDLATLSFTGHGQVHLDGYQEDPSIYKTMPANETLLDRVRSVEGVEGAAPRVFGQVLVSNEDHTAGAMIVGVNPKEEDSVTAFQNQVKEGQSLGDVAEGKILVGTLLADILHAEVGQSLVLVGQGADGSLANNLYTISGLVQTGMADMDRSLIFAHIGDVQEFFVLQGRIHEIAFKVRDVNYVEEYTEKVRSALTTPELKLEILDWNRILPNLSNAIAADKMGGYVFLFIIAVMCALVVLNTVLMSVLERTRELGILKALGTRPLQVGRMVVYETLMLSIASTGLGMGVGLLVIMGIRWAGGIPLGEGMEFGGVVIDTISARYSDRALFLTPLGILTTGILVAVLPALRAARIIPVKAIHQK